MVTESISTYLNLSSPTPSSGLTADRTYFVAPDGSGSDSDNGLSVGTAFATIPHALDIAESLETNRFTVTIQLLDGTHTQSALLEITELRGNGNLVITGNSGDKRAVILDFSAFAGTTLISIDRGVGHTISFLEVEGNTSVNLTAIRGQEFTSCILEDIAFTDCFICVYAVGRNSLLLARGDHRVESSVSFHSWLFGQAPNAVADGSSVNLEVVGNPTPVSGGILFSDRFATINVPNLTVTGAFTGGHIASLGGRINTENATGIGTGTEQTGGQIVP